MEENQEYEKKSLMTVTKLNPDWSELAKDCVCFANSNGGKIIFGIEDKDEEPPHGQKIPKDLSPVIIRKITSRTLNVSLIPQIVTYENGSECLVITVQRNVSSLACTSGGRYYARVSDECKPVLPDELSRLITDRNAYVWETQPFKKARKNEFDKTKLDEFVKDVINSDRISKFVKEKSPEELMEHYFFINGEYLSNLGVLWIGKREHRANLLYAPIIQFIKKDEQENKVNKIVWDDYSLNPKEMIQSVLTEVPDWKEGIEIPEGIFRRNIYNYDEVVIRELIANALVHRPYTIKGDIFINLFPDRLEVHNPGLLPLGVTPKNILHKSTKRNNLLAKVFYDLHLMESEGSGYDRMFEVLLSSGKPLPEVYEEDDRVRVIVKRRILSYEIINLIDKANQSFQLRPREVISLGLIAQHNTLTAIEFNKILDLKEPNAVREWLGRLMEFGIIKSKGKTKGMSYFVIPDILKKYDFKGITNLKKIELHRLRELIYEDLSIYRDSSSTDIQTRIGKEISINKIRKQLEILISEKKIGSNGKKKWKRYFIT